MNSATAVVPSALIECARDLFSWTTADDLPAAELQVASALQTLTRCNCLQASQAVEIVVAQEFSVG